MLDVLLDDEWPRFPTLQVHKPELIVFVTATIDSNDHIVGPGNVACSRDGLVEKRDLDSIAALRGEPVHLHAAGVVAANEELGTVRCDVGDG